jgi:hypothetical protein
MNSKEERWIEKSSERRAMPWATRWMRNESRGQWMLMKGFHANSLKRELRESAEAFEAAGGRGVDLAEKIDDLRIVLAVRMVSRGTRGR